MHNTINKRKGEKKYNNDRDISVTFIKYKLNVRWDDPYEIASGKFPWIRQKEQKNYPWQFPRKGFGVNKNPKGLSQSRKSEMYIRVEFTSCLRALNCSRQIVLETELIKVRRVNRISCAVVYVFTFNRALSSFRSISGHKFIPIL